MLGKSSFPEYDIIDFIPDADMKENESVIEIPDGKIVDWDESKKQNKIVLKDKQLTYKSICKKLFDEDVNNATTRHQIECILAKNKLATVAKYLNGEWKSSSIEDAWYIVNDFNNIINICEAQLGQYYCSSRILFKREILAKQAIKILGEETIKLALEPLGI